MTLRACTPQELTRRRFPGGYGGVDRRAEHWQRCDTRVTGCGRSASPDHSVCPEGQGVTRNVVVHGCTSRQRNTHSTESRDVRYPWHPWFGRSVTVYEALTKGGHAISRCGFDDQRNDRSLEVPAWMFESAACDHLRLTAPPFVDCQALIELKAVLQTAPRADVLQAPHHSFTASGGADATGQRPIPSLATDPVSSAATPSAVVGQNRVGRTP